MPINVIAVLGQWTGLHVDRIARFSEPQIVPWKTNVYFARVLRHLEAAMNVPTLAAKLGTTTHLSPLLRKTRRLGLGPEELQILAVRRGCDYYHNGGPLPLLPVPAAQFSNAELAIALLNPALPYSPQALRLGAAMLSADGNTVEEIAHLAEMERCEAVVRYVAEAGRRFETDNPFWLGLLQLLPAAPPLKSGVVPHPTRFVAMTGFTRRGVETVVEWIRPTFSEPAHG